MKEFNLETDFGWRRDMVERQMVLREKAKVLVNALSEVGSVSTIGVMVCRYVDVKPMDGIILGICIKGDLDNRSFNEIISIRDGISNYDELPIDPLVFESDTEPYEIVWTKENFNII